MRQRFALQSHFFRSYNHRIDQHMNTKVSNENWETHCKRSYCKSLINFFNDFLFISNAYNKSHFTCDNSHNMLSALLIHLMIIKWRCFYDSCDIKWHKQCQFNLLLLFIVHTWKLVRLYGYYYMTWLWFKLKYLKMDKKKCWTIKMMVMHIQVFISNRKYI